MFEILLKFPAGSENIDNIKNDACNISCKTGQISISNTLYTIIGYISEKNESNMFDSLISAYPEIETEVTEVSDIN
jgi:hypothetical protein